MLHTHYGYSLGGRDVTVTHNHHCEGGTPGGHDHDGDFLAIYHDTLGAPGASDEALALNRRAEWLHRLQGMEDDTRTARNDGDRRSLLALSERLLQLGRDIAVCRIPPEDPLRRRVAACGRAIAAGLEEPA